MEIQTAPAGVPAEQQIGGGRGHVLERRVVVVAAQICKGLQIVCDVVIWELAAPSNNAAPRRNCRRDVRKICHIALVITQKWRMPFAPLHWRRCRRAVRLLDCVNQPPRVIWRC